MDHLTQEQINNAMNKTYGTPRNFLNAVKKYGLGAAVSVALISNANAADVTATVDVTSVVSTITNGVTTVSSIGLAVLSLFVVIKIFKWVRSAM
ncbi:hypothetical protein D7V68_17620, partial [Acinetobacter cumulans]|uniref:major capsid protein n=1 Tax=Acinetobacter cumulans TaxID=2136182 RepID=UPI000EA2C920